MLKLLKRIILGNIFVQINSQCININNENNDPESFETSFDVTSTYMPGVSNFCINVSSNCYQPIICIDYVNIDYDEYGAKFGVGHIYIYIRIFHFNWFILYNYSC